MFGPAEVPAKKLVNRGRFALDLRRKLKEDPRGPARPTSGGRAMSFGGTQLDLVHATHKVVAGRLAMSDGAMPEAEQKRAPSFLDPDRIEFLRQLTRIAQATHPPAAWPNSMRWQMENVRNFARGKVKRPKPLLQAELAAYFLTFPDDAVSESFRQLRQRLTGRRPGGGRTVCDGLLPAIDERALAAAARYHGRYIAIRRSLLRDRIVISVVNLRRPPRRNVVLLLSRAHAHAASRPVQGRRHRRPCPRRALPAGEGPAQQRPAADGHPRASDHRP